MRCSLKEGVAIRGLARESAGPRNVDMRRLAGPFDYRDFG
jgi:hypothetical protein